MKARAAVLACTIIIVAGAATRAQDANVQKTTLALEAPPREWKARPKEAKPFVADYDIPAAEGDKEPARANVLFYPMGFEDYRKKIVSSWKHADGTPYAEEGGKVETIESHDLKLRVFELEGTHAPKHGPEQSGVKMIAVHIRGASGKWTAWLLGPQKTVDASKAAYLAWLETGHEVAATGAEETAAVREVRFVHGAPEHGVPGPWALVAYRIGKHALAKLGVARGSFELSITHRSPKEVRYSCMLDGLLASTGCSPGKLNLAHEPVDGEDALETIVVDKKSGRKLVYKLTKSFRDKIRDVPPAGFPAMAGILDSMKDDDVFTVEEGAAK